jgi:hypothetical protein
MEAEGGMDRRVFLRNVGKWSSAALSIAGLGALGLGGGCDRGGGGYTDWYADYANYADYFNYANYADYADYVNGMYSDYADYANYSNYGDYFDYADAYGDAYSDYANYGDYFDYVDYSDYANYGDAAYTDYGDYANYADYGDYVDIYLDYMDYSDFNGVAAGGSISEASRKRATMPERKGVGEVAPRTGAAGPHGPARQGLPEELQRPHGFEGEAS